jgi:phosphatidylglycerophosphatase C
MPLRDTPKSHVEPTHVIAAFDFDGTLTYHDTLFYFLLYTHGIPRSYYHFIFLLPAFLLYAAGFSSRQDTKEKVLKRFFGGRPIEEIRRKGEEFAREKLSCHLRPEGMRSLRWHQKRGDRCVLVSASLDIYLNPWTKLEGLDHSIASELATTSQGMITGKLQGKNCRGSEKVRRLKEWLGAREQCCIYAYGDSDGDWEMLAFADYPFYRTFPEENNTHGSI